MLSARSLFTEILDNDESFRLFCSIAASGEAQGGWENGRIAALVPETQRSLAPKIARHGADEDKHGRIFMALLNKRGLEAAEIPDDTDYTMILEGLGIGLAHEKLRREEPLTERDVLAYLAHSRVTEQRAAEEMALLVKVAGDRPDLGRAVAMISRDEDNHLAYCHEELLRLARAGHGRAIHTLLRESAMAEITVYRDVGLAVMSRMARILGWSRARYTLVALGIHGRYVYERLGGWRRMVRLRMPERRDALGTGRAEAAVEFA
ncbi:ferritin-like domain-containing protein [Streptomyces reniochalinae]|uniref:Ferritin-like domain-containing protein n=1 Tax=Streptomyces reniochalinae TaxID=2250578 RepID=A0A367ELB5_9ACTN|nr:ferritin-like domain-containing protein [Streptomyces reniochalinae]RCG18896.1 ferritin-like domain-containing protein [Streptomyces reniochalinae]